MFFLICLIELYRNASLNRNKNEQGNDNIVNPHSEVYILKIINRVFEICGFPKVELIISKHFILNKIMINKNTILNKIILTLVVLLFSFSIYASELTVMSINVQGHGPGSSEHRVGKDKWENQIVSIIKKSKAKLVLLQEFAVRKDSEQDKVLIEKFLKKLKGKWEYETSALYSISSMDLNNAILYNTKYLKLVNDLAKQEPFNMYDYKLNQEEDTRRFKFIKNNEQILEFEYKDNNLQTFYVINIHLPAPNENVKKNYEIGEISKLYATYKRKIPLIIAGDFNISRKELLRGSNLSDAIIDGNEGNYIQEWGQKTTMKQNKKEIELASDYDHIIISKNPLFSVSEQMHHAFPKYKKESYKKLKIGKEKYTNSFDYCRGLSDHIPIVIKLKFND